LILNSRTRSIATLLLCAGLAQGAWAQMTIIGPGFTADPNGYRSDDSAVIAVEQTLARAPSWYLKFPEDTNMFFVASTQSSSIREIAVEKAIDLARN